LANLKITRKKSINVYKKVSIYMHMLNVRKDA